jgi:PAS domain S-box-containing protein
MPDVETSTGSENQLEQILAVCAYEQSMPLVISDDLRNVIFINRAFERLTGWKSAKKVNGPVWNLLPPNQRDDAKKFFSSLLN